MSNVRTSASQDKDFIDAIIERTVLETAIEFITERWEAEELYGRDTLETWALDNGFVRESRLEEIEQRVYDLEAENQTLQRELNDSNG
jgi:predicted RNase H-like nuclease (RuvC/YqgF family)